MSVLAPWESFPLSGAVAPNADAHSLSDHLIASKIAGNLTKCKILLTEHPDDVTCDTTEECANVKQFLFSNYHLEYQEKAMYNTNEMLWICWAHMKAVGDLTYRLNPGETITLDFASNTLAQVRQYLYEWSDAHKEISGESIAKLQSDLDELERKCVIVLLYYWSNEQVYGDEEKIDLTAEYQTIADEIVSLQEKEDIETKKTEIKVNAEKLKRKREQIIEGNISTTKRRNREKKRSAEDEFKEHLMLTRAKLLARFGNTKAYSLVNLESPLDKEGNNRIDRMSHALTGQSHVMWCTRLFSFTGVQFMLMSEPNTEVYSEPHPALYDPVHCQVLMGDWLKSVACNEVSSEMEKMVKNIFYTLGCTMGCIEHYLRRFIALNYKTVSRWNVFMQDQGPQFAQFFENQISFEAVKILDPEAHTPASPTLIEAWSWTMWNATFLAYVDVDFMQDYVILANQLMYKYRTIRVTKTGRKPRRPLIIQLLNQYFVQHVYEEDDVPKYEYWLCKNYKTAMYTWACIVHKIFQGELHNRKPLPGDLQKLFSSFATEDGT